MTGARRRAVLVVGLGAIGSAIAARCAEAPDLHLAAAVDPARSGETVEGVEVRPALDEAAARDADVAVVATGSRLAEIAPLLEQLLAGGLDVASTAEELAYPWWTQPDLATRLDDAARGAGRTLVACGVNPGFVMDALPAMLASASLACRGVRVQRRADLDRRRPQLRDKLGVGLPTGTWRAQGADRFGHRGLVESALLCATALGWEIESTDFRREPLERDEEVTGVSERAVVTAAGGRTVELELVFDRGVRDRDLIRIDGDPPLDVEISNGLSGDTATVARALHAVRTVGAAPPGLVLPTALPTA